MKKHREQNTDRARSFEQKLANSLILSALVRFFEALSRGLSRAPLSGFFAKRDELEEELSHGGEPFFDVLHDTRMHRRFYKSAPMRLFRFLASAFVHTAPRAYATFFLGFGGVIILAFLGEFFKLYTLSVSIYHMIAGFVLCLIAVPLCVFGDPLYEVCRDNRFLSFILHDFFGLRRSVRERRHATIPAWLLLLFGIGAGFLGAWKSPYLVLAALGILLLCGLVIYSPEFGLMFLVIVLPFLGLLPYAGACAAALSALCLFGYIQKLLVGKRVFEFRPLDFLVLLFSAVYLFGGILTGGGRASFFHGVIGALCVLVYFVAENLLTNRLTLNRFITAFMVSAFFVAAIGVFDVLNTTLDPAWLDRDVFARITVRITSVFGNPNILAAYLLLAIPFSVLRLFSSHGFFTGLRRFIHTALLLAALVLTFSRGAWIALAAIFLFSILFCTRRNRFALFVATVTLPTLGLALPESVLSRFYSIGLRADTSVTHRFSIWRGVLSMLRHYGFGGVGVGEEAFSRFFVLYAEAGTESAVHSHSLYLQIFCELGIFGILVFLGLLLIFLQSSYTHMYRTPYYPEKGVSAAVICAVLAVLIHGLFDHVFYNSRIFLLFFLLLGLASALRHFGKKQVDDAAWQTGGETSAALDMNL